jgi:fatty-acyl-CoA synthase
MYDVTLNLSHFPAQYDAEVCDITVGDLLRETAASHPDAIAMVDIADNGDCGQSWTYGELLEQGEALLKHLLPVLRQARKSLSGRPISRSGFLWNMPVV